jgi:Rrf2 family protein
MRISRELDYGVRAIVVLAAHEGQVMSKRTIAKSFGIPVNFLAIILPKLVQRGIVESLPGPRGGYRLARQARLVSLYDVIFAVDRDFTLARCLGDKLSCDHRDRCPVVPYLQRMQEGAVKYLKGVTFDKLAEGFKAS